jgi:hypothetical protein
MRTHSLSWLLGAAVAVIAGCADTATCDPNEMLYAGRCMPLPVQEPPPDAASSDEADGAVDAGTTGDASDEH